VRIGGTEYVMMHNRHTAGTFMRAYSAAGLLRPALSHWRCSCTGVDLPPDMTFLVGEAFRTTSLFCNRTYYFA
jgi:hypothetical protein